MFGKLIDKLKERLTHFRLGDSLDKTIDMGAIVDETQKQSIEEFVEEARKEGAEVRLLACFYCACMFACRRVYS